MLLEYIGLPTVWKENPLETGIVWLLAAVLITTYKNHFLGVGYHQEFKSHKKILIWFEFKRKG